MNAHQRRRIQRAYARRIEELKSRNDIMYADWASVRVLGPVELTLENKAMTRRVCRYVWADVNDPMSVRLDLKPQKKILPLRSLQVYRSSRGLYGRGVPGNFHRVL